MFETIRVAVQHPKWDYFVMVRHVIALCARYEWVSGGEVALDEVAKRLQGELVEHMGRIGLKAFLDEPTT